MLRQKPSIHNSRHDTSTEHTTMSKLDTTVDSTVSALHSHPSESVVGLSETREPDEIEVQFPAHIAEELSLGSIDGQSNLFEYAHDVLDPIAEVDSVSEDTTIWRCHDADNVDVYSTASATSDVHSVFSALTDEPHTIVVESHQTSIEQEQNGSVSLESHNDESS
jgi:hypothetical protein